MLRFDAEASRRVEALYLTADVVEQRRVVLDALALAPGERVVDIGTGPGLLAADMAAAVGADGAVCGVDVSESMLAIARARALPAGGAPVQFQLAGAERLPYGDATFDVAVSTQVLEYVADVPRALGEIRRVLRPGGRVLILDTDWDSVVWHSGDEARMDRVLAVWERHLVDPHLPRTLGAALRRAGFDVAAPRVLPVLNAGFHEATYSAGLIDIVAAFVAGRDDDRGGPAAEDAEAWAADLRGLGPDYFFSLNRYLFLATSPG